MKQRAGSAVSLPVPALVFPPLPEKIARLDPEGAKNWVNSINATLAAWIRGQNTVSGEISSAIKT